MSSISLRECLNALPGSLAAYLSTFPEFETNQQWLCAISERIKQDIEAGEEVFIPYIFVPNEFFASKTMAEKHRGIVDVFMQDIGVLIFSCPVRWLQPRNDTFDIVLDDNGASVVGGSIKIVGDLVDMFDPDGNNALSVYLQWSPPFECFPAWNELWALCSRANLKLKHLLVEDSDSCDQLLRLWKVSSVHATPFSSVL